MASPANGLGDVDAVDMASVSVMVNKINSHAHRTVVTSHASKLYGLIILMIAVIGVIIENVDTITFPQMVSTVTQAYVFIGSTLFLAYLTYEVYIVKAGAGGAGTSEADVQAKYSKDGEKDGEAGRGGAGDEKQMKYRLSRAIVTASMSHLHTSIFLRAGICLFSLCYLAYFLVGVIVYEMMASNEEEPCIVRSFITEYCLVFFVIVQTIFITLGTSVAVKRRKALARFGLIQVMVANILVWLITLIAEINHTLHAWADDDYGGVYDGGETQPLNATDTAAARFKRATTSDDDGGIYECYNEMFENSKPFLIPFIHEYCLVLIGCLASIYASLNPNIAEGLLKQIQQGSDPHDQHSLAKPRRFHNARIGLAIGLVIFVGAIVSVALYYVYEDTEPGLDFYFEMADFGLQGLALIALVTAIVQIHPFHVSLARDNSVDGIMLIVAFAGFTMIVFLGIMTELTVDTDGVLSRNYAFETSKTVVEFLVGLLQTGFILVGMQRVASTGEQRERKPGRQAITYLIIANLAHWVFESSIPGDSFMSESIMQFGPYLAATLLDISIPLVLFFRFHSAVCLAHMYHALYEIE